MERRREDPRNLLPPALTDPRRRQVQHQAAVHGGAGGRWRQRHRQGVFARLGAVWPGRRHRGRHAGGGHRPDAALAGVFARALHELAHQVVAAGREAQPSGQPPHHRQQEHLPRRAAAHQHDHGEDSIRPGHPGGAGAQGQPGRGGQGHPVRRAAEGAVRQDNDAHAVYAGDRGGQQHRPDTRAGAGAAGDAGAVAEDAGQHHVAARRAAGRVPGVRDGLERARARAGPGAAARTGQGGVAGAEEHPAPDADCRHEAADAEPEPAGVAERHAAVVQETEERWLGAAAAGDTGRAGGAGGALGHAAAERWPGGGARPVTQPQVALAVLWRYVGCPSDLRVVINVPN
mmetsp:Transcript_8048/g.20801  ORF Transcript_8048/g.20801 Transcript_8048/m.20801 type:complete len:345 (-) Transcript_8048:15-1049(-)